MVEISLGSSLSLEHPNARLAPCAIGKRIECDVRGFKLSRAGTSTYWDRLDYVVLASTRPAAFEVDLADLAEWFAQARMALLGHSTSRHNHQYHSNSFGAPRDHRIPCAERYGLGTRCRHRREVVCCRALRRSHEYRAWALSESGAGDRFH